ncbi:Phytochrome-like protein cph2 [Marinomonas spartinae]|uniref:bifunctional diguanylate cyclase/phosphodiesterase n=1 Tax=Marinomonas spartinae TaxID=1792290 RepID=UPI000808E652|nr:EAL domain-containing protein [Marinomonas spartinae]SBS25363.1 Phytochrome-like protein cph2 [Marinomonas spartinae]
MSALHDELTSTFSETLPYYKVLSVEDDLDYQATLLTPMSSLKFNGKEIQLLTANSASSAAKLLSMHPDISVILLDVVMETDTAGLCLVNTIRQELGNHLVRVVLLTGQPGMAPVKDIMDEYDIDDCWSKSELTHDHLQTIILSNLRTWHHLNTMSEAHQGLQFLVESTQRLAKRQDMIPYIQSVLKEITQLFPCYQGCAVGGSNEKNNDPLHLALVIAACGEFERFLHQPLSHISQNEQLLVGMKQAFETHSHVFLGDKCVLYFANEELGDDEYIVIVTLSRQLAANEARLLKVMSENIGVGFRNVALHGKLSELAYFDASSGMHNKNWLTRELSGMSEADRQSSQLVMLQVEDFAHKQTVFGLAFGHQLMRMLYLHLLEHFTNGVDIALTERDTLAILIRRQHMFDEVSLTPVVHACFNFKNSLHSVDMIAGLVKISEFPHFTPEQLINAGECALEHARQNGRHFLVFNEKLASSMVKRYGLLNDLRQAILDNEISVFLQPKVSLQDGRLVGFEALARWKHKDGHFVPPDQFIPLAESCGLIGKLDHWVMQLSCRAVLFLEKNAIHLPISVNVAGSELLRTDYFDQLIALLKQEKVPPNLIELEITETQLIQEKISLFPRLESLKSCGIRINVDDFGTGYSSLAYLSSLPVSTLKVDHSFVWNMDYSEKDYKILKMIVELGSSLELNVIAEGIETQEQCQKLKALGCHEGQGYLFCAPMPVSQVVSWTKNYTASQQ